MCSRGNREDEFIALRIMRMEREEGRESSCKTDPCPIRTITCDGARVALQRCPILRAGKLKCNTRKSNFNSERKES